MKTLEIYIYMQNQNATVSRHTEQDYTSKLCALGIRGYNRSRCLLRLTQVKIQLNYKSTGKML